MKRPLSKTYKELGIDFVFPIEIKDPKGNETYYEDSDGYWWRREYDEKGNLTYYEDSSGYWWRREYDEQGNETYYEDSNGDWWRHEYDEKGNRTYYENSDGRKEVTPRASCNNKVITIDGKKYKLTEL